MFYRIVLQGCAGQGVTLDEVKRQFSFVTGLPPSVTDRLFVGAPTVLKRQVGAADAERISLTLRAIGANVTVEPEFHSPAPVGLDPVTLPGLPMAAHHIEPPVPREPEQDLPPRKRNSRAAKVVLTLLVVAGAMLAAYQYEAEIRAARKPAVPLRKAPADAPEAAAGPPAIKPAHAVGPWRCTDQDTGASTFWNYGEDGTLSYHGDDKDRRDKPIVRPGQPVGWTLDGNRLTLRYESAPAHSFTLDRLSLAELDYRNAAGDEVRCRRP